MKNQVNEKIKKAEKEIKEAQDAVLEAAEQASGQTKEALANAARDLEKAECELMEY
jgi:vacuolar-type H+-ATPase subunit H